MTNHTEKLTLDEEALIGNGTFGNVYRIKFGRVTRAVKSIPLRNNKEVEAAQNELRLQVKLSSEYVVAVFDHQFNKHPPRALIVMEYMEGGSLEDLIKDNPLQEHDVTFYLKQILKGVAFMHENQVVHRDLKPENFLLDKNGNLKICDLGVAKMIDTIHGSAMKTLCGSPQYMSPELLRGKTYRSKTDIWSIGATLVHMITGREPYPQLKGLCEIMWKVVNREVKYDLQGMATPPMDDFVGRLMEYESAERPNALEALETLEQFQTDNNTEEPSINRDTAAAAQQPNSESIRLSEPLQNLNLQTPSLADRLDEHPHSFEDAQATPADQPSESKELSIEPATSGQEPDEPIELSIEPTTTGHESDTTNKPTGSKRPRRLNQISSYEQFFDEDELDAPSSSNDGNESRGVRMIGMRISIKRDTGQKQYECTECSFKTKWRRSLKNHQVCRHSNERPFKCAKCDYAAARMWLLKEHEQKHSDERPFACGYPPCQKRFKTATSRYQHENIHRGVRFECKPCKVSFAHRNSYRLHMQSLAHTLPMHSCRCGKSFTIKSSLKRHQKSCTCR